MAFAWLWEFVSQRYEEAVMVEFGPVAIGTDEGDWQTAMRWAAAFLAGFQSAQTRKNYRRDLHCWFALCAAHGAHPYRDVRRTHLELYLRHMQTLVPPPAAGTIQTGRRCPAPRQVD